MADNYDNVCSICGQIVNTDTLYYCCPECHRMLKVERNEEVNREGCATNKELLDEIRETEPN